MARQSNIRPERDRERGREIKRETETGAETGRQREKGGGRERKNVKEADGSDTD